MKQLIAIVLAAVAAVLLAQGAWADADFSDAAGDAGAAPDLIEIHVANDAFDRIVFVAKIAGGKPMAANGEIVFVIDADKSASTGEAGWDYIAALTGERTWNLWAWDGAQWVAAAGATVKAYFWDDVLVFSLARSELGGTTSFGFFVAASVYSGDEIAATDNAPEGEDVWSYATVRKTFGIDASPILAVTNGGARVGKPFVAGYVFGRTDSPEPASAKTTCVATLAGKRIRAAVSQGVDAAVCRVALPARSKGKTLKLTMTTTSNGKSVTRTYTTKVR